MDFDLSEEQRMLKDSVDRLVADKYDFDKRKAYLKNEHGFSREVWAQFADLGLLALPFAEADGGFGGGPVETMIVMESLGRALAVEPYLATVVLSGGVLRHAASEAQRAEFVPQIASGEKIFALAHHDLIRTARGNVLHLVVIVRPGDNLNRWALLARGGHNLARFIAVRYGQQQPARAVQMRQIHDLFVCRIAQHCTDTALAQLVDAGA